MLHLVLACARAPVAIPVPEPPALDAVAPDYVKLILGIGELEPGYVDAWHGPPEWAEAAKSAAVPREALVVEADRLIAAVDAAAPTDPLEVRRRAFLAAQLRAARFRLDLIGGARPSFDDEVRALYAVSPDLAPLSSYDPLLARVEEMIPGDGPLSVRVEAWLAAFVVPSDRLDAVMRRAIAECRTRTLAHLSLPAEETFTLEFVTGKSWGGYNWYQGDATSLIQVNTDFPIFVDRAVTLGCHEGYPGHHTHNVLMEERLLDQRGWVELSVYPLYSPLSLIAEGEGNYGTTLAFPDGERLAFERDVLFPLAGLDPETAASYAALRELTTELQTSRMTISRMLLDGEIDRPAAVALLERYLLVSGDRAEQAADFIEEYRSYVVNYGLGEALIGAAVERAGPDPVARWAAMEAILSQPTIPADLLPPG